MPRGGLTSRRVSEGLDVAASATSNPSLTRRAGKSALPVCRVAFVAAHRADGEADEVGGVDRQSMDGPVHEDEVDSAQVPAAEAAGGLAALEAVARAAA